MDQKCEDLKKKLEANGLQQLKELKNGPNFTEKELMALMQKGGDEFKAQMGRPMSYGEMREMYGWKLSVLLIFYKKIEYLFFCKKKSKKENVRTESFRTDHDRHYATRERKDISARIHAPNEDVNEGLPHRFSNESSRIVLWLSASSAQPHW